MITFNCQHCEKEILITKEIETVLDFTNDVIIICPHCNKETEAVCLGVDFTENGKEYNLFFRLILPETDKDVKRMVGGKRIEEDNRDWEPNTEDKRFAEDLQKLDDDPDYSQM